MAKRKQIHPHTNALSQDMATRQCGPLRENRPHSVIYQNTVEGTKVIQLTLERVSKKVGVTI